MNAPGLDTREVEQRVDQSQQTQRVSVCDLKELVILRKNLVFGLRQHLLEWIQHQRQRRAEFMAHIGEKCCFGAIDLGQSLGAHAFRFEGARLRDARRDVPRDEIKEASVAGIEDAARAHAGNQKPGGSGLSWCRQRQHEGRLHRIRPGAGRKHTDIAREIRYLAALLRLDDCYQRPRPARGVSVDDGMVFGEGRRTVGQSGSGDATRTRSLFVKQVNSSEWNIQRIAVQNLGRIPASELGSPLFRRTGAEIA